MDISDITPEPTPTQSVDYQGVSINPDVLMKEEIELGGKMWRIKKLLPFEAKQVLIRYVRPCLKAFEGLSYYEKTNSDGFALPRPRDAVILELLGKFPADNLEMLSEIFTSKCIEYRDENGRWCPVSFDPGKAFMGLDPAELILLDAMAFMQNFRKSVSVIEQRLLAVPATGTEQ